MLAYRATAALHRCLRSVALHESTTPFEVVVVANGATPEVLEVLEQHPAVHIVPSRANRGFAGGCNLGARAARGELLLFLNDDTLVSDGWLDALVHLYDAVPTAGCVGSAVVDLDDTVLEFGSSMDDFVPSALDRGRPFSALEGAPPRRVSYASACSMLVDRALFDSIGGFDEAFYPAYFEDVDLCWRIWQSGRDVLVTPASAIVHEESASSSSVIKSVLFESNAAIFRDKWSVQPSPVPPGLPSWLPRVALFDDFVPRAQAGSGLSRSRQTVLELAALGHQVVLHPNNHRFGVDPALRHRGVVTADHAADLPDAPIAVVASRPHNFEKAQAYARRWPAVPVVYDAEARFSARLETQLQLLGDTSPEQVEALRETLQDLVEMEAGIAADADAVVAISDAEAEWFAQRGARAVHVLDPFPAVCPAGGRTWAGRSGVLFVAGWLAGADSPNGDAVRWLAEEIVPELAAIAPRLVIEVTGAQPPGELVRLAGPHLRFVGEIPDLRRRLDTVRVTIAPIRYGAGVKLKLVDALSHAVPSVSTELGCEGIATPWLDGVEVRNDPAGFAQAIARLHDDETHWNLLRSRLVEQCTTTVAATGQRWRAVLDSASAAMERRRDEDVQLQRS